MGLVARNTAVLLGGAALTLYVGMQAAHAQQTNEAEKKGRVTLLQRLILGAGAEKVAIDTPQSVSVVDQDDIDDEVPTTVSDVIKTIPGINLSGSERVLGQTFNIRGVGGPESGGEEGRIIVNIDGVNKFYEQYRMGGLFTDMELYKRVEVLRGPASSTLYGAGALGGVVNFTTKDASDFIAEGKSGALRLKGTYDSNPDGLMGSAILAHRFSDNLEVLAMGNYRYANNYTSGDGTEIPGSGMGYPTGLIKGTLRFGDNNEQVVRLSHQHFVSDRNRQFYSQVDTEAGFGLVDRKVTDSSTILSYENPASDNPWIDLKAQFSYSDTVSDQYNAGIPSLNRAFSYSTYQYNIQNTFEYTGENFENYLTVGSQTADQTRLTERTFSGTHPRGRDVQTGLFAQNEFIWDERLTLIAGARVDWQWLTSIGLTPEREQNDTAFSPKVAAHYKFNDNFAVFGSYAHTERTPSIDEVFDSGALNSRLNKEKSDNYELGFSVSAYDLATAGDALSFKATGFYNDVSDMILDNGSSVSPRYTNTGLAEIYGTELEVAYDSDYLFANAGYSMVRGTSRLTGLPLNTVAPDELSLTVGGRVPDRDLTLGWTGRFVAAQDRVTGTANTRSPTPGFATHDVFLTWKPQEGAFRNLEADFRIENIFNKQYQEFLEGTPAKGRTFKVSLARKFDY